jgi:hypothetical protein
MRKLFLILGLSLVFSVGAKAQDVLPVPTPTPVPVNCSIEPQNPKCAPVTVTQGFLDNATDAFKQLVAYRNAYQKLLSERALTDQERKAYEFVITQLDEVITIGKKVNDTHVLLEEQYQKIIKIQGDIIDRLNKQLTQKKGFLDKLLGVVEKIVLVLAGVTIGRGL